MTASKDCSNCRMLDTCILHKMATAGVESFNQQQTIMKFPFNPNMLALTCPKFETEDMVVRLQENKDDEGDPIETPGEAKIVQ